jgi:hypothetical protein
MTVALDRPFRSNGDWADLPLQHGATMTRGQRHDPRPTGFTRVRSDLVVVAQF